MQSCELCTRECDRLTVHHLTPRQHTKRKKLDPGPTATICSACHRQIHSLFHNRELAQELNTLDRLRQHPKMEKFLRWIQKQDASKRVRVHRGK
jgi:ATP-dependent protease Clp ATPase subunit